MCVFVWFAGQSLVVEGAGQGVRGAQRSETCTAATAKDGLARFARAEIPDPAGRPGLVVKKKWRVVESEMQNRLDIKSVIELEQASTSTYSSLPSTH